VPLVVLFGATLLVGVVAGLLAWARPVIDPASPRFTKPVARLVERELRAHDRLAHFVRDRLNPVEATGLLLTVAFVLVAMFGVLGYLVRTESFLVNVDLDVARWAADVATPFTRDVVDGFTQLGGNTVIVLVAIAVAAVELWRAPSRYILPFLVVVVAGQSLATNLIKVGVGRVRPAIDPLAGFSGDSFPSGHSASAAATFAACAMLLGRRQPRWLQCTLTGIAGGLAAGVASSRVLLGVHWLTDVIAGLALGWGWFALSALAFGGRMLHFGAPVELGERAVDLGEVAAASDSRDAETPARLP